MPRTRLPALTAFLWLLLCGAAFAGDLVVTFLSCGQGDAAVIRTPGNKTYLIDAGPSDQDYGGNFNAGESVVVPYLKSRKVAGIGALLISHPHLDHYGGGTAVLKAFSVKELIDPRIPSVAPPYLKLLETAEDLNVRYKTARKGDTLEWDPELLVEVLWPSSEVFGRRGKKKMDNINDRSLVLKITHGKNSFLFPGDAEKAAEEGLAAEWGRVLQSTVLKVPHHGSRTSSTESFLDAVSPRIAVISCGAKNQFGHPHREALERLKKKGIKFYRTDEDGGVELTSDGKTLTVSLIEASEK